MGRLMMVGRRNLIPKFVMLPDVIEARRHVLDFYRGLIPISIKGA
jgi:hypothetical protein